MWILKHHLHIFLVNPSSHPVHHSLVNQILAMDFMLVSSTSTSLSTSPSNVQSQLAVHFVGLRDRDLSYRQ